LIAIYKINNCHLKHNLLENLKIVHSLKIFQMFILLEWCQEVI